VVAVILLASAGAVADGDPASDVLAAQAVYVPGDGGLSAAQTARLSALVTAAQRTGVPIRVALIATQADLGSVTELWGRPQSYARFLGQELSQVYRGTLVVAMPAGFGIAEVGAAHGTPAVPPVTGGGGGALIPATIRVVQAIAAAHGRHLAAPAAVSATGSGSALGSVDLGSWLALGAGAALIAAAWAASLRARPWPRLRRAR
jgi:hypothetical protein